MSDEYEYKSRDFEVGYRYGVSEAMGRIKQLERENEELKKIVQLAENDLYHICKFNADITSTTLVDIKKFMRENNIDCLD